MDNVKPVLLPLQADVSRCLGHNGRNGEHCHRRDECARHATISHRSEPWEIAEHPYYRMCSTEDYHCFMEFE